MQLPPKELDSFTSFIWNYYKHNGRQFDWRNVDDPYSVVVSEIMLQQTQTKRVAQKYPEFMLQFPSFEALAKASLKDVLSVWQGLGYNRRGKYLHQIAQQVVQNFDSTLPQDPQVLVTLPGIGLNTAGSIAAFAFNKPTVFIETNIRTVFLHLFFQKQTDVHDKLLLPLIEQTVCKESPREWYYALMDYGVELKKQLPNPSRKSKHHTKQSKFEGSDRQIRGMIIKLLTQKEKLTLEQLCNNIDREQERIQKALQQLCDEKMVEQKDNGYAIKSGTSK